MKKIDFEKFINADDIDEIQAIPKGVSTLLLTLELSSDARKFTHQKEAYYALSVALDYCIERLEDLKQNINYMGGYMREAVKENER